MDYTFSRDRLFQKLIGAQNLIFDNGEEYFFTLGQFLTYSFSCLGGIHKYNKEFNYLTNPYLPKDIQQLGLGIVRFITKLYARKIDFKQSTLKISQILVENSDFYCNSTVNIQSCTDAFFEGLHSKNMFEELSEK
jgi:hypothetical protein